MLIKRAALLCVILALLIGHAPARAQTILTIKYEDTLNGTITRDVFRQVYTFTGKSGDVLDMTVKVTGGTLDPILIVTDSQNKLLARTDDRGVGFNAALAGFQVPANGSYFIIVARFGQERGLTTGSYALTLARVGVSGGPAQSGRLLRYGDNVVGDITQENPEAVYSFTGKRGDLVRITMQRISGDLDPALILADLQGTVIAVNDEDVDSPGTLDASITDYLIRSTDNYLIVATRFGRDAGTTRGGFSLSIALVPPDQLGATPDRPLFIDYGQPLTGKIDTDNQTRYYQFEGKTGDVVTIDAERKNGTLDPVVTLLTLEKGNARTLVTQDAGQRGQNARISAATLPRDGLYGVAVSRYNGEKGFTAGDFTLSIIGRQGVLVAPNGTLVLSYGGAVTASIQPNRFDEQYVFEGRAGDLVTIVMQPTSDTLLPYVMLFDQNKRLLAQDDPNKPAAAQITRYKLAANGGYIIVASRHGRSGGTSQGNYLLTLGRERS